MLQSVVVRSYTYSWKTFMVWNQLCVVHYKIRGTISWVLVWAGQCAKWPQVCASVQV